MRGEIARRGVIHPTVSLNAMTETMAQSLTELREIVTKFAVLLAELRVFHAQLVRAQRPERLERAVSELSPDHREVIRLARFEGLKVAEIAKRMERSPGAIHQLLARAMDQLKHGFGDTASLSLPDQALDFDGGTDAGSKTKNS